MENQPQYFQMVIHVALNYIYVVICCYNIHKCIFDFHLQEIQGCNCPSGMGDNFLIWKIHQGSVFHIKYFDPWSNFPNDPGNINYKFIPF